MSDVDSHDYLQQAVRRRVGLTVLGRLHALAVAEQAKAAAETRWARRLTWVFVLLALVVFFGLKTYLP